RRTGAAARRWCIGDAGAARADESAGRRTSRLAGHRQPRAASPAAGRHAGSGAALAHLGAAAEPAAGRGIDHAGADPGAHAHRVRSRRRLPAPHRPAGCLARRRGDRAVRTALRAAQLAWQFASTLFGGIPTELPLLPALGAAAMSLAVLAGFALPPLLRLAEVPPVAVFRQSLARRVRRFDALYLLPALVALALIWSQSGSLKLAGILAASLAGVALVAALLAALLLWLARRVAPGAHPALRLGLAALARRRGLSVVQATALALGLTALLLLSVVAPALLDGWRRELPADTPNWFALNLQDEQRAG